MLCWGQMIGGRVGLRRWVIAWLVFQAVSLSAMVPRDCCLAHRPAAGTEVQKCHEAIPEQCVMRASCDGPMAGLLTLLSNLGVPVASPGIFLDVQASTVTSSPSDKPVRSFLPPDSPPPRA